MFKKILSHPKYLVVFVCLVLAIWFASGNFKIAKSNAPKDIVSATQTNLFKVETFMSHAQDYYTKVSYQGYLESWQSVVLRSQLNAYVEEVVKTQGSQVKKGDILVKFSDDGRTSQVNQTKAFLELKKEELKGMQALRKKNLSSKSSILGLESQVAGAQVNYDKAKLALDYSQPKAPFDGILDEMRLIRGEYVNAGQIWGSLVDVSKLKAKAQIPQQRVKNLKIGQVVDVILLDGTKLSGKVFYISASASAQTRSFRLEIEVENPDKLPLSGASATLHIYTGKVRAHKISLAYLGLNDKGKMGVKYIDADNKVAFMELDLLSSDKTGAWVANLPDEIQLISLGAGFTQIGQKVQPILSEKN